MLVQWLCFQRIIFFACTCFIHVPFQIANLSRLVEPSFQLVLESMWTWIKYSEWLIFWTLIIWTCLFEQRRGTATSLIYYRPKFQKPHGRSCDNSGYVCMAKCQYIIRLWSQAEIAIFSFSGAARASAKPKLVKPPIHLAVANENSLNALTILSSICSDSMTTVEIRAVIL